MFDPNPQLPTPNTDMLRFLARRAVSMVFVMFSLTFLTFIIGRLAPGSKAGENDHQPQADARGR